LAASAGVLLVTASLASGEELELSPTPAYADADYDDMLSTPDSYLPVEEPTAGVLSDGSSEVEVIRERYPNRRVKIEREVVLDADGNYVNHGAWKMWSEEGKLVAEGSYNMGERVGVWTRWHQRNDSASLREYPLSRFQSPFVSQTTFVGGKIDGDWIIFDANQEKCCHITVDNGVRNGKATIWLPGGQIYRHAMYENDVPIGDVEQLNREGVLETVATYVDGRRAITKVTHFDGTKEKKTEANYLGARMVVSAPDDFWNATFAEYQTDGDQLRHGAWKTWYSNGQLKLEGYYRRDVELGTFTWWHPNGQRAVVGQYVDGGQHGEWVWWHDNGQKATVGDYQLGAQSGLWRQWTADGKLESQQVYDFKKSPEQIADDRGVDTEPLKTAEKPEFPAFPWMQQ
jgi:antitoxin component YwqK of YwqJK toxin-antitoxin module